MRLMRCWGVDCEGDAIMVVVVLARNLWWWMGRWSTRMEGGVEGFNERAVTKVILLRRECRMR